VKLDVVINHTVVAKSSGHDYLAIETN